MELSPETIAFYQKACRHLTQIDSDWARLIELVGDCALQAHAASEPYEALVRAVHFQQLHGKAATTILGRVLSLYPDSPFPSPEQLIATPPDQLHACGLSLRKVQTIQGVAQGVLDGVVPLRADALALSDEELIERLTSLKGIGRWTVEMLLIFTLERRDVMPADDFGVRNGYRLLKQLDKVPSRKEMEQAGLVCQPYRSVAAWYLWQAVPLLT